MNKSIARVFIANVLLLVMSIASTGLMAQTRATTAAAAASLPAQEPVTMLPASDAIVTADIKRVLNEALPKAFSSDQAKMAEINADIDRFKTRTGINLRSIEKLAMGVRFHDLTDDARQKAKETGQQTGLVQEQPTRLETVAIARGTFDAGLIVAAGRLAAKDKYRTEKYGGKNIYIFTLDEQMKLFGLFKIKMTDVAVSVLDTHTLAFGQLGRVREAIDAAAGRGTRANSELLGLATRNPNAMIGFGSNVPPAAMRELGVLGLDSDEISKNIASIRQVYGSIGMTANGFDMTAVARTDSASAAQGLNDTIAAAKEFVAPLVSQFLRNEAKAKLVRHTLDSLKVTTAGNELQLRFEVAQSDIATIVSGI